MTILRAEKVVNAANDPAIFGDLAGTRRPAREAWYHWTPICTRPRRNFMWSGDPRTSSACRDGMFGISKAKIRSTRRSAAGGNRVRAAEAKLYAPMNSADTRLAAYPMVLTRGHTPGEPDLGAFLSGNIGSLHARLRYFDPVRGARMPRTWRRCQKSRRLGHVTS